MGKKSGPPAPDFTGAANAQSQASKEIALQQTYADRPNINTPWGQQTWKATSSVDPTTGKPVTSWGMDVNLSPQQQSALDDQFAIDAGKSSAAQQLLGQATQGFQAPMDWNSLPGRSGNMSYTPGSAFSFGSAPTQGKIQTDMNGSGGDYRQRAQDAVDQLNAPDLQQRRTATQAQLANQGISQGSEAYNNAMRQQDDAETRSHLSAIEAGRGESAQMFGQDLQSGQFHNTAQQQDFGQDLQTGQFENDRQNQSFQQGVQGSNQQINAGSFNNSNRQQAIAEALQRRGQGLNELNALLTGSQVSMPNMPSFNRSSAGQAPDLMEAAKNQYGAAMDSNNIRNNFTSQLMGTAGQLGSAAFMFSDARLKEEVATVGYSPGGHRVVHYRYRGLPGSYIGVIAQEALLVSPEAVALHPSGYLMVDYSKVR